MASLCATLTIIGHVVTVVGVYLPVQVPAFQPVWVGAVDPTISQACNHWPYHFGPWCATWVPDCVCVFMPRSLCFYSARASERVCPKVPISCQTQQRRRFFWSSTHCRDPPGLRRNTTCRPGADGLLEWASGYHGVGENRWPSWGVLKMGIMGLQKGPTDLDDLQLPAWSESCNYILPIPGIPLNSSACLIRQPAKARKNHQNCLERPRTLNLFPCCTVSNLNEQ